MNKRGYFFMVDAILASVVIFIGLFALFGGGVRSESAVQPLVIIEDFVLTISANPVSATLDPYYTSELLPAGLVPYPEATPVEQIYYLLNASCGTINCTGHAENYTLSLFSSTLGQDYGGALYINNTLVAQQAKQTQRYVLTRSFIVYARINDTTFIGPTVAEVRIWS